MKEYELAKTIQGDTLTILLCNRINSGLDVKHRAIKIAKCCKVIRDKTQDKVLYNACRSVIKAVSGGHYIDAIKAIHLTESNYFKEYKQ